MTNEQKTALITKDRKELITLGNEFNSLLPNGSDLTPDQAVSLAKYSVLNRANPFRGEVYGYTNGKGNLQLVDGYKLLVRWAKNISDYSEKYEPLQTGAEGLVEGDIGYQCRILRDDKKSDLTFFIEAGASFQESYNLASVAAVGVVAKKETNSPPA